MKERLNQLDGLKVVMSLWIVLFHYSAMFTHRPEQLPFMDTWQFSHFLSYGKYCVEVFFVINGFLIAYTYKEKIKGLSLSKFLSGRVKYLYWSVAFSVILAITDKFLFAYLLDRENKINFWRVLTSLTMTSTGYIENVLPYGAVSWYIGVLLLCYAIYYFVAKASNGNKNKYLLMSIGMVLLGAICIRKSYNSPLFYNGNGRGYCCFFLGVMLFEIQNIKWLNKRAIANIGLVVCVVIAIFSWKYGIDKTLGNVDLAIALFIAPMVVFIFLNIRWIKVLFGSFVFRAVGKITTALYLTHTSVMSIIYTINRYFELGYKSNEPRYLLFNVIMTLVVAVLWYFIIEKLLVPLVSRGAKKLVVVKEE